MRTVALLTVTCISLGFTIPTLTSADDPVIKVNPHGKPNALSKGDARRYGVWYDAEGWHLRTDTAGKKHEFTGLIDVIGGKVTAITNFDNLETGKKEQRSDSGMINETKDQISFKFHTGKKRDGFDFQVDGSAKEIRFTLLIDGQAYPDRILIGSASQPAPAKIFTLPANPR